jgi:hypothetical protein
MGYFVIIMFTTFMGSPPKFLPVAFKSKKDCEYYLSSNIINKSENYSLVSNNESKYLINYMNNKFIICNKLEYPINKQKVLVTKNKK